MPAAERARRYRARLRARGLRIHRKIGTDASLAAVRFRGDTLLTPGERDVLRRFCAALPTLSRRPTRVAAFGSRTRGGSTERSDLDVAVFFEGARDRALESGLSAIALAAQKPYSLDGFAIALRPVAFYREEPEPFLDAIRKDLESVWKER